MNKKRVNLDICKWIINGEFVRGQDVPEDKVLILPEQACFGYILPKKDVAFSMDKVRMLWAEKKQIVDMDIVKPENEIKPTDYLRMMCSGKEFARKFTGKGGDVWINTKFMKNINVRGCKFYQACMFEVVIVMEADVPVMVLLPLKILEERDWH